MEKIKHNEIDKKMRDNRKAIAIVIDDDGETKFRIISTVWLNGVLVALFIMLLIIGTVLFLAYSNSMKIERIEQNIDVQR